VIPDAAIEFALIANWDTEGDQKERMRAALEAAAPHIVAQALNEAADELAKLPYAHPDAPDRAAYLEVLAVRRGNTDAWLRARAAAVVP
jgi:hypothetical protein